MKQTLQDYLKEVGQDAEIQIPDASEYSSCFGLFHNWRSPVVIGRQNVLRIVYWLRGLAQTTDQDDILEAALYLAIKFIQPHRDTLGEIKLFEELDAIKTTFNVHFKAHGIKQLKAFSQGHIHMPDIIKEYTSSFESVVQINSWLNQLHSNKSSDDMMQAGVYLAYKYLKHHQTIVDEVEMYVELEQYKTSHQIHYSKNNIIALSEYSKNKDHDDMPPVIRNYLKNHASSLEITHWLAQLSRETTDKHVLRCAYIVVKKYAQSLDEDDIHHELLKKLKHYSKSHWFHSKAADTKALVEFSEANPHVKVPDAIIDTMPWLLQEHFHTFSP